MLLIASIYMIIFFAMFVAGFISVGSFLLIGLAPIWLPFVIYFLLWILGKVV